MWRAIYPLLLFNSIVNFNHFVSAKYFSDGGTYSILANRQQQPNKQELLQNLAKLDSRRYQEEPIDQQYYDVDMSQKQQPDFYATNQQQQQYNNNDESANRNADELAEIVNELGGGYEEEESRYPYDNDPYRLLGLNSQPNSADINADGSPRTRQQRANLRSSREREEYEADVEKLQQLGKAFKQINNGFEAEGINDEVLKPIKAQSIQKKGQSEFVEFVAPVNAKIIRNKEFMEKRVAANEHGRFASHRTLNIFSGFGNVAFMAFITMCCVMSVVGVVGGMYYYNHVRTTREDPFDDFTRYSPAGPGRDKLKRVNGKNINGTFVGELGDDTLAYKAQLHHYQQNKQKIIGAEEGRINGNTNNGDADDDDISDNEADLEHNFSVYECPGLAPTGDIEVQNPNFVEKPNNN